MLKSLILPSGSTYFQQASGPCFHYAPNTAALLYEVTPVYHRGKARSGHTQAKSEAMTALELSGSIQVAALAHRGAGTLTAALYTADELGNYEWQRRDELPWHGLPVSSAIVHIRHLSCPLTAYKRLLPTDQRIALMNVEDFIRFAIEWVRDQPYYFPALRRAELAVMGLRAAINHSPHYLTIDSLPSYACYALFREVGNVRRPSPDLFDESGNAIPSKTRINPESVVYKGGRNDQRKHVPRAYLVYDLFTSGRSQWDGTRFDDNPSNDRIENIAHEFDTSTHHHQAFIYSMSMLGRVFPYKSQLPTSLYLSRGWRYGIERLAFNIDER